MSDYPERQLTPEEIYKAINPEIITVVADFVAGIKDWWSKATVHDRKIWIDMAFNNSQGSEEKVVAFLDTVGAMDKSYYIDHYNKCCAQRKQQLEGKV